MKSAFSVLVVLGIILLAASFLWPQLDDGSATWTDDKAAAYQEVSARLHILSFRDLSKVENKELFDEADGQHKKLDAQLQSARDRGAHTAFWLKIAGGVLAAIGGVGYLIQRGAN